MKKIVIVSIVFLAVFMGTLFFNFPYGLYLTSVCDRINSETKLNIVWDRTATSLPSITLFNVRLLSEDREVASFEKLDLKLNGKGITFKGARENCRISGAIERADITYAITELPVPEFLQPSIGKGTITFNGTFNKDRKKGKGTFEAAIEQFPNPLISGALAIDGSATMEPQKTALLFNMKGKSLSGKGTIAITTGTSKEPPQISGVLDIKVGEMKLQFDVKGTLDNISISKAG